MAKYKKGDLLRWTGADDSMFAYGRILKVYKGNDGEMWYLTKWEILGSEYKHTIHPHDAECENVDNSEDIRPLTPAEHVLFMEGEKPV